MNIVLTGSSGFIGSHLKNLLKSNGYRVICLSKDLKQGHKKDYFTFEDYFLGNIDCKIDYFLHLASPNFDYCKEGVLRAGIVDLTKQIIKKLPTYECKKFIYFSSAKVYGEPAFNDNSFSEQSLLNPLTDYAKAIADAEELIQISATKNEFKYIIYRLPMVYGPGMKSNIANLLGLINSSIPFFYFNATNNFKKSMLSIENIKRIITYNLKTSSSINNQILNIADAEPLSLNEIIFEYKKICSSRSIMLSLPGFFFKALSNISMFKKLYGGFVIDNCKLKNNSQLSILNISQGLALLNVNMNKDE